MKSRWAQRPVQILAFEHHLQPVKWGRIVQNGFFLQGACPLYAAIHFVRSVPMLQVVNGVQMLKFDLGAAPTTFSPIPPGRKLRGTQRPPPFLKNPACPPPVVACFMYRFLSGDCADFCLWTVRIFCLWTVRILSTLLASLVAGASRPQGSLREPVTTLTRYRFPRYPTLQIWGVQKG